MKKILCTVLAFCVVFCTVGVTAYAEGETPAQNSGELLSLLDRIDVDKQNGFDTNDARIVLRAATKITLPEGISYENCDLDGDGKVTLLDAYTSLEYATGIRSIKDDAVQILNTELNSVKTEKPGFSYENVLHCKSCKVTTGIKDISAAQSLALKLSGYYDKMVVTDKNIYDYFKDMEAAVPEADKASYRTQLEDAKALTEPQTTSGTARQGIAYAHTRLFPVAGSDVSSTLTAADILSATVTQDESSYFVKVTLGSKNFTSKDSYIKAVDNKTLSYAKAFNNLPSKSMIGDSALRKLNIKNGAITITIDKATGAVWAADYAYDYEIHLYKEETSTSDGQSMTFTMLTKQTVSVTDHYAINH